MDINNNQLTNTFTKGMNTDSSELYIPTDQYRYAENLRLLTDVDSTFGELHTIKDAKPIDTLNKYRVDGYLDEPIEDDPIDDNPPQDDPVETNEWSEEGYYVTIKKGESDAYASFGEAGNKYFAIDDYEILECKYDDGKEPPNHKEPPYIQGRNLQIIPIFPVKPAMYFSADGKLDERPTSYDYTIFVTLEDDDRTLHFSLNSDRMGFFDNINITWPIRIKLNIVGTKREVASARSDDNTIFEEVYATTTIRDYGVIVCKLYGDAGWSILRYSSGEVVRVFGPCTDKLGDSVSIVGRWESDNNVKVYLADGKHELMCVNIDDENRFKETNTDISSITQYNKTPLNVIDAYVESTDTVRGTLKSAIVQYAYILYKDGGKQTDLSPLSKPLSLYKDLYGGFYKEETDKAVKLWVNLGNNFGVLNRIRVFRLNYYENGLPPLISIIYDDNISSNYFEYVDTGFDLEEISLSEFLSNENIRIKPLLIESKNDYLFAGNVEYIQEDIDKQFENVSISLFSVSGIHKNYKMTDSCSIIENVNNYGPSLKAGETYRYGVVLYDLHGRKSSVKWLADYTLPNDSYIESINTGIITGVQCEFKRFGIQVNIPANIPNCSGIEIVRCKRELKDSKNLYLGFVGLTKTELLRQDDPDNKYIFPLPYYSLWVPKNVSNRYLTFACPEYVYQNDDVENVLELYKNLQISEVASYAIYGNIYSNDSSIFRAGWTQSSPFIEIQDPNSITDSYYIVDVEPGNDTLGSHNDVDKYDDGDEVRYFYTSYVVPVGKINNVLFDSVDINNIYFANAPEIKKIESGLDRQWLLDDSIAAGSEQFINWFIGGRIVSNISLFELIGNEDDSIWRTMFISASGGKCMLLNADTTSLLVVPLSASVYGSIPDLLRLNAIPITVMNISKKGQIQPYGGNNEMSKKYSVYYSFGNYISYDGNQTQIDVYDGDCYNCMFTYHAAHAFLHVHHEAQVPVFYSVPIQSSIDLRATSGKLYSQSLDANKCLILDYPSLFYNYVQDKPAYVYDTAYSQFASVLTYTFTEKTSIDTNRYDTRVINSLQKINGEHIDNWLIFKSADFIDVDTRYGELTDIRLFKDALIFWQNKATGVLSVNERTIIQDQNDTNIILGNGDILQRYDYLTTEYGMKPHQFVETQSDSTLYWWDGYKKEILSYSGGQSVQPMNKVKTVANYINENEEVDKPSLTCDHKYNEVLMHLVNSETLVYNEAVLAFTSIYKISFEHCMRFKDNLIIEKDGVFRKWDSGEWMKPSLEYIVNNNPQMVKVFDMSILGLYKGWHVYSGGDSVTFENEWKHLPDAKLDSLKFTFFTEGTKRSSISGEDHSGYITSREYDYRFTIPRYDNAEYGSRMRGRTMLGTMTLTDNYKDFSIQYITTKYRISYS